LHRRTNYRPAVQTILIRTRLDNATGCANGADSLKFWIIDVVKDTLQSFVNFKLSIAFWTFGCTCLGFDGLFEAEWAF
jgi:hypothetical protein